MTTVTYTDAKRVPNWLGDDRDGTGVGSRSGHEKDQRRPRTDAAGDQRGGDGCARRGADVQWHAHQHHDRVGEPARVLVGHQVGGNHQVEHPAQRDAHQQREQYVIGYLDEPVAEHVLDDVLEIQFVDALLAGFALARAGLLVGRSRAVEIGLDPGDGLASPYPLADASARFSAPNPIRAAFSCEGRT